MSEKYKLKSTLGRSYNVDPNDVLTVKKALNDLGYYEEPEWGITPYPDNDLFKGIEGFQKDYKLKVDGLMKPNGPTEKELAAQSHRYVCTKCTAFHGGVFSPYFCSDCYTKMNS